MGPCASCELNSPRSHPRVVSACLTCLGFCLQQSKTTVAAQMAEWSVLMCHPGRASSLISEWISLWDHCMIWGLGLHHPHKFLGPLRKVQSAERSLVPFLRSKALVHSHFYVDRFYKGSRIEVKCQISLLAYHSAKTTQSPTTEWPWHLSAEPWVFLDFFFFSQATPSPIHTPSTFPLGG